MTDEENELKSLYNLTDEQLNWRRYKIKYEMGSALLEPAMQFKQEYPMTPEEAFISTGRSVFNIDLVRNLIEKAKSKSFEEVEI